MSTQKMSYFSDIDLATLHRTRLNERIQYKLSWFNRRQKYCIPAANKSVRKRDNSTPTQTQNVESYASNDHKFNANAKHTLQSINGLNGMKGSNMSGNDLAKITTTATTNRQRKNGYNNSSRNKKKTLTSVNNKNNSSDHLNHLDDTKTKANEFGHLKRNEPAILNRTHGMNQLLDNNSTYTKQSARNCDKIETLTSSNQSIERFITNNSNVDSSKRQNSAMANRTTQLNDVMSNKRNVIRSGGGGGASANIDTPTIVEQIAAIEEEDLELPHRKRSGTWP